MVNVDEFIEEAKAEIAEEIGDKHAVIGLSAVSTLDGRRAAYEAIGDQLTAVYVDTGLMRKGETDEIRETFDYMDSLRIVEAQDRFLDELEGETDPEEKRHIIGEQFIREFETVAREADASTSCRGPSTPTASSPRATSSPTTTSAACPSGWTSTVSSTRPGPLQGRGPRGRPRARPRSDHRRADAVPRSRAGGPRPRRSHAEKVQVARDASHVVEDEPRSTTRGRRSPPSSARDRRQG